MGNKCNRICGRNQESMVSQMSQKERKKYMKTKNIMTGANQSEAETVIRMNGS